MCSAQGWDVSTTVSRALECGAELEAEVRAALLLCVSLRRCAHSATTWTGICCFTLLCSVSWRACWIRAQSVHMSVMKSMAKLSDALPAYRLTVGAHCLHYGCLVWLELSLCRCSAWCSWTATQKMDEGVGQLSMQVVGQVMQR